jgi:drug/metabolite transporter (DMT)-like permease
MLAEHSFAWLASLMYGTVGVIGKLISRHSVANPWLLNFFWNLFILVLIVPVVWWQGGLVWPSAWANIIWASLFYAGGTAFYVLALYKMDVSVLAPLFSFRTALAVVFGAAMLGELLTSWQYFLIAVIFLSGLFVSVDERFELRSFFNWGTALALLDMLFLVLMAVFIKKSAAEIGYWGTTLWSALLGQVCLLVTWPLFKKDLSQLKPKQYGLMFIPAVAGMIGTLAVNKAYAVSVSLTSAIISLPLSMVIAFCFSVLAPELLEKHTFKVYAVRFAAAAVMIVAALNL